jgi:hypothetical protein
MSRARKTALAAGVLYVITFVSIPTLTLYKPVLDHADFVLGAGATTGVMWGAVLEIIVALACIGTAVVLFPVARRQSETAALGFVAARVLEASLIFVGVISLLTVVTLRQDVAGTAGADSASLVTTGHAFVGVYRWTFLLGQSLMPVVNAACLGYVMYRSSLVPRAIPMIGLIGAPLLLASDLAIFAGLYEQGTRLAGLAALPIAAWEFSLGVWLVVKGFKLSPIAVALEPNSNGGAPRPPKQRRPVFR